GRVAPFALQFSARGVVRSDSLPRETVALDFVGENPRPHLNVRAGIIELILGNAVRLEAAQVGRIDLHEPDVVGTGARAVRAIDDARAQVRLALRDRVQQTRIDL